MLSVEKINLFGTVQDPAHVGSYCKCQSRRTVRAKRFFIWKFRKVHIWPSGMYQARSAVLSHLSIWQFLFFTYIKIASMTYIYEQNIRPESKKLFQLLRVTQNLIWKVSKVKTQKKGKSFLIEVKEHFREDWKEF